MYKQEKLPYILVSYCYTDRNRILPLIQYLDGEKGGSFRIKYDSVINLPMEMDQQKAQEIKDAHAILVFVSGSFISNRYFDDFMNYTKYYSKPVIIAYMDYVSKIPAVLRLPVETYHYMRFDNNIEEFSDELLRLGELDDCCTESLVIDGSFDLMNKYRSLVQVTSDFFMSAKNQDESARENFANHKKPRRDNQDGRKNKKPEELYEEVENKLRGTYYERRDAYGAVALLECDELRDYLPAIRKLADCYQRGIGTEKNFAKAEMCFRKAALKGDIASMLTLALFLSEGRDGVRINREEAFYWFKKAAIEGNASAWYHLGFCYEHGSGTKQNISEAMRCYKKGIEKGDSRSRQAYNALCRI